MRNGIYTAKTSQEHAPSIVIAVHDEVAIPYSVGWYGDLNEWEIYPYTLNNAEPVNVSAFPDDEYPEMISSLIHVYWDEVYVDRYDTAFEQAPSPEDVLEWWKSMFD